MNEDFCASDKPIYPKWTTLDVLIWQVWPESWGGGAVRLNSYKDGWIIYNKNSIIEIAKRKNIPAIALASIAWQEVGGDPDIIDSFAFPVRSFDWSGPDWIDKNLTITRNPTTTSFGSVSIQLRNAAFEMGFDAEKLSYSDQNKIARCLEENVFNLEIVAKHLVRLIQFDYPNKSTLEMNDEQLVVLGSRYNRGTSRALKDIVNSLNSKPGSMGREYSEYGRAMLKNRKRIQNLLR